MAGRALARTLPAVLETSTPLMAGSPTGNAVIGVVTEPQPSPASSLAKKKPDPDIRLLRFKTREVTNIRSTLSKSGAFATFKDSQQREEKRKSCR